MAATTMALLFPDGGPVNKLDARGTPRLVEFGTLLLEFARNHPMCKEIRAAPPQPSHRARTNSDGTRKRKVPTDATTTSPAPAPAKRGRKKKEPVRTEGDPDTVEWSV